MSDVWRVPADDGSGEIEIRPVTVTPPIGPPTHPQWIKDLDAATAEAVARILRGDPPPCEHRYCIDQGYALCMGVAGAQIDMLEDSGLSRAEAVRQVIAGLF